MDLYSSDLYNADADAFELGSNRFLQLVLAADEAAAHGNSNGGFKKLGAGGFGSIFQGLLKKTKGPRNLLYQGPFEDEYAEWDHRRFVPLSFGKGKLKAADEVNDPLAPTPVVVKHISTAKQDMKTIIREAANLKLLAGPRNAISVYGVFHDPHLQGPCIVMDEVDGINLNRFLKMRGTFPANFSMDVSSGPLWWKLKLEIFRDLVLGVMHCHRHDIYHGDLKGENVLVDKYFVPKLVDFGLSFGRVDRNYIRDVHFSWFWAAPEIAQESTSLPRSVLENPYPSDVYALGMVLVEMSLDGEVPTILSESEKVGKFLDGIVIPFNISPDMEEYKAPLQKLEDLVEQCCRVDREDRVSLDVCLMCIEEVYAEICAMCSSEGSMKQIPLDFQEAEHYQATIVPALKLRFPSTPDCIFFQLQRNMMLNTEGELLIHALCRLDFWEGVRYIIGKGACSFEASKDIPYMSLISVRSGSLEVLKFFATVWTAIVTQELVLVHEACKLVNRPDMLRFLLFDLNMPYNTWGRENPPLMPIHKLAKAGQKEMVQVVLDRAGADSQHIDAYVDPYKCKTPLYYAVKEDDIDTVYFLMQKGATIYGDGNRTVLDCLFSLACRNWRLRVMTGLLSLVYVLQLESMGSYFVDIPLHECEHAFAVLEGFVSSADNTSENLLKVACQRGREEVFQSLIWLFVRTKVFDTRFKSWYYLLERVCRWGSKEMLQLVLEQIPDEMWNKRPLLGREASLLDELCEFALAGHDNTETIGLLQEFKVERAKRVESKTVCYAAEGDEEEEDGKEDTAFRAIEKGSVTEMQAILAELQPLTCEFLNDYVKRCCAKGRLDLLKLVLDMGHDDEQNLGKNLLHTLHVVALHYAANYGAIGILNYLLKDKRDIVRVDVRANEFGNSITALICAAQNEKREAVAMLLEAGADANAMSADRLTAMDFAILDKDSKMIELLIQFNFDTGRMDRQNRRYIHLIATSK